MSVPSSDVEFCCHNTEFGYLCWPLKDHEKLAGGPQNIKNADVVVAPKLGSFGHVLATRRSVGPIGTAVVCSRTEEPGEQRFCENRRLKQPMGLPFSEWADAMAVCSSSTTAVWSDPRRPPIGQNRAYLLETTTRLLDRRRLSKAAVVVSIGRRDNEIHFACNKPRPHIRLICRDSG